MRKNTIEATAEVKKSGYNYQYEPLRNLSYEDSPKVRGVLWSLVIAVFTWLVSSHMLALVFIIIHKLINMIPNNDDHLHPLMVYSVCLMVALFFDFFGHFTALIAFFSARTEPSLRKTIWISLFKSRLGLFAGCRWF